ncbi:MAG: hypothetical protein RR588_12545 [Solibacillus sp.]
MKYTTNYKLRKPERDITPPDAQDINDLNANADIVDGKIKDCMNGIDVLDNSKATKVEIAAHIDNKNNPHNITKSQIGLGNVDNTADVNKPISTVMQSAIDSKVDKINGKQLSTEDYTTVEKNKLAGVAVGANNYVLPIAQGVGTSATDVMSQKATTDAISRAGYGDMLKAIYDTNDSGTVDAADSLKVVDY